MLRCQRTALLAVMLLLTVVSVAVTVTLLVVSGSDVAGRSGVSSC